jgi:hypothetical protein
MITNSDLERSYNQYIRQQELGHMNISRLKKSILTLVFIFSLLLLFFNIFSFSFKKKVDNNTLFIFPFNEKEPMGTILKALSRLKQSRIIVYPKALPIFPLLLLKDFLWILWKDPLWTVKNLDFFGALSIKISKYYGYKRKYSISKLLLFQEYSFYSSYLTYIFESENASLYNLMHGVPGPEASFFRFTKFFVWGEYFKKYYVNHNAEERQFVLSGSLFHKYFSKFESSITRKQIQYDIVYALQGDLYCNNQYLKDTFTILEELHKKRNFKIAIKPHPIYSNNIVIPQIFDVLTLSLEESILKSKLILSHFSTIFLDAKILNRKVIAFLEEDQQELVAYLNIEEICCSKNDLYEKIEKILDEDMFHVSLKNIINLDINTLKVLEDEIN